MSLAKLDSLMLLHIKNVAAARWDFDMVADQLSWMSDSEKYKDVVNLYANTLKLLEDSLRENMITYDKLKDQLKQKGTTQ